jgi:hypothetical protein
MKKRGRPREFDGTISVRLTAAQHDALCREAIRSSRELSDVIRDRLFVSQKSGREESTAQ